MALSGGTSVNDTETMSENPPTPVELPESEPESVTDAATRSPHPRIVVGVDGSDSSIAALRWGARIASALSLDLQVVAVWQYPVMALDTFYPFEGPSPQEETEKILTDAIATVFDGKPPLSLTTVVRSGPVARTLIEQSEGAEMLVVGSRGHGGFVGLLLGSVSATVAEHAHCPVLVVHEAKDAPDPRSGPV